MSTLLTYDGIQRIAGACQALADGNCQPIPASPDAVNSNRCTWSSRPDSAPPTEPPHAAPRPNLLLPRSAKEAAFQLSTAREFASHLFAPDAHATYHAHANLLPETLKQV
ncbi:MAG: hypothetical protein J7598_10765 [Mitsuaria chitosanitabida]|uniref:hypothetical protein n=1 Tax=Roseateles chitosanitabidus TaxID=65048 RepID=UPI001B2C5995|nr:hypothetical protein [Roseateles chitosanitabidus]MBO9687087.1 hypothetical protein [Roseateles chitosanitabidus]